MRFEGGWERTGAFVRLGRLVIIIPYVWYVWYVRYVCKQQKQSFRRIWNCRSYPYIDNLVLLVVLKTENLENLRIWESEIGVVWAVWEL